MLFGVAALVALVPFALVGFHYREGQLDTRRFVRIHRSYLLNIERLSRVELYAKDSRVAILADGTKLPVSRSGYQRLQQLL